MHIQLDEAHLHTQMFFVCFHFNVRKRHYRCYTVAGTFINVIHFLSKGQKVARILTFIKKLKILKMNSPRRILESILHSFLYLLIFFINITSCFWDKDVLRLDFMFTVYKRAFCGMKKWLKCVSENLIDLDEFMHFFPIHACAQIMTNIFIGFTQT